MQKYILLRFIVLIYLTVVLILFGFHSQKAYSMECGHFLDGQKNTSKLVDRSDFFQGLNEINSKTKYIGFLNKFLESILSKKINEKHIVRIVAGLERRSVQYLLDLNLSQIEFLLRLFVKANRKYLSEDFLRTVEAAIISKIEVLNPHQAAQFVYLFGRLSVRPTPSFLDSILSYSTKDMDHFTAQNLSNSLFGFGLLSYSPGAEYLKKWFERFNEIQDEFSTQHLSNSVYSIYLLKEWGLLKSVLQVLDSSVWLSLNTSVERRIISQVYNYAKIVLNIDFIQIQKFEKDFFELIEKPQGETSDLEQAYELRLSLSDIEYEQEYKTSAGFYVDFYIPSQNKVVNVDGPSHFIKVFDGQNFSEIQRPQDHLIDDLLRASGYNVVRIHYSKLN
jgi:very-short-patch-repair endonuclease